MRKDNDIARFVFHLPPAAYQCARFTDWFRPYLEEQLADPSRASAATNQYFRNKYDLLAKAMAHLEALEPTFAEFEREQREKLDLCLAKKDQFSDLEAHWAGAENPEVIKHFPPQLIIGKQVADERQVFVDDEDPFVKVELFELDCEYAYSAPTGMFNLQVPHVEVRASAYQTQSYEQYKRAQAAAKNESADPDTEATGQSKEGATDGDGGNKEASGAEQEDLTAGTRDWDTTKRQGAVLLKVVMTNKSQDKDLKIWYRLRVKDPEAAAALNVELALSARKTYLNAKNQKIVLTLLKVDPSVPYFVKDMKDLNVELDITVRNPDGPQANSGAARRVQHAQTHDVAVGGAMHGAGGGTGQLYPAAAVDYDDGDREDRDDDAGYAAYQANPQYAGYAGQASAEEEQLAGLLDLQQPQGGAAGHEERRSAGSTDAVAGEQHKGASRQNSGDYLDLVGADQARCSACQAVNDPGAFNCDGCGEYLGSNVPGEGDDDLGGAGLPGGAFM